MRNRSEPSRDNQGLFLEIRRKCEIFLHFISPAKRYCGIGQEIRRDEIEQDQMREKYEGKRGNWMDFGIDIGTEKS